VLALSAHSDRARVLEMLEAGADGYLVKGTPLRDIVTAITDAASGQGILSSEVAGEVIQELVEQLNASRRDQHLAGNREQRVRDALTHGNLSMVFQPICTLGGDTVGAESLARFASKPRQGPERWFADAVEVGLLLELEIAAAREALTALPALPQPLYLTINVSPSTLASTEFRHLLAETDGARVVVEITEHAPINDYKSMRKTLATLRALGTRIAIDDAGAGFASLRHILRLEPDFIKLDRSLIDGIETNESLQALAAGLISFGEKINAKIIAEGIERASEVETLLELGVRYGQGFFFARPAALPVALRLDDPITQRAERERDAA
jgi:EAL domain-containing protein (putative c-di-GMP-specific phosphodiesterase class I)